ncbi:hypothetical protein [uncultured Dysosmobacter sp.]|uniref:hypothetical protein n=1 Tax=uncultured Dysosmobacter sp. TaxID=2591384 RepID=UPI00263A1B57|nr:hypothetical protein [uncultured Dysosmobacter sp.]
MKQTENYQLTQWEKSDRIQMEDFNRDNAALDAALTAQAAELAAVQAALTKCGNCRVAVTTYTGTGTYGGDTPTTVPFPAKPLAFMIVGPLALLLARGSDTTAFTAYKNPTQSGSIVSDAKLTWTENTVSFSNSVHERYQMNEKDAVYWVLALYQTDGEA